MANLGTRIVLRELLASASPPRAIVTRGRGCCITFTHMKRSPLVLRFVTLRRLTPIMLARIAGGSEEGGFEKGLRVDTKHRCPKQGGGGGYILTDFCTEDCGSLIP